LLLCAPHFLGRQPPMHRRSPKLTFRTPPAQPHWASRARATSLDTIPIAAVISTGFSRRTSLQLVSQRFRPGRRGSCVVHSTEAGNHSACKSDRRVFEKFL